MPVGRWLLPLLLPLLLPQALAASLPQEEEAPQAGDVLETAAPDHTCALQLSRAAAGQLKAHQAVDGAHNSTDRSPALPLLQRRPLEADAAAAFKQALARWLASPSSQKPRGSNTDSSQRCGMPGPALPGARVVGGSAASKCRWRWHALIAYVDGSDQVWLCSGALVQNRWVMTTASCTSDLADSSKAVVFLGAYNLTEALAFQGTAVPMAVASVQRHPDFDSRTAYPSNDLALVQLAQEAAVGDSVAPVCLPSSSQTPPEGTRCWVTGWGTKSDAVLPTVLQQGKQSIFSSFSCSSGAFYGFFGRQITGDQLCALGPVAGDHGLQNPCGSVDFGAPLVCEVGATGQFVLQGLVSYGPDDCGDPSLMPFVYARVAAANSWVNGVLAGPRKASQRATALPDAASQVGGPVRFQYKHEEQLSPSFLKGLATWKATEGDRPETAAAADRSSAGQRPPCGTPGTAVTEVGKKVVNGRNSEKCHWRWQATMLAINPADPSRALRCGATVISEWWVMTKATGCFYDPLQPGRVLVWVGAHKRSEMSWSGGPMQPLEVSEVHVHPNFQPFMGSPDYLVRYDAVLLKLAKPLELGDCLGAVCLPPVDNAMVEPQEGEKAWGTGFGQVIFVAPFVKDVLQEAPIWPLSQLACGPFLGPFQMPPEQFCAIGSGTLGGTLGGGVENQCGGDQGSPLMVQHPGTGQYVLQGILSLFEFDCGTGLEGQPATRAPGIYQRVGAVMPWVLQTVGGDASQYAAGQR